MILRVHWNLRSFLKKVESHLVGMKPREKREIIAEIRTHIKERAAELNSGIISSESIDSAIEEMEDPKEIAARYREDEEIRVELGTRLLLLANVAWSLCLIVVSASYYASGWDSRHTLLLTCGILGIILGAITVSLYLVQCLRPGIIPSMRVYVLAPALCGASLLFVMMVALVSFSLPWRYPNPGWTLDQTWAMAVSIPILSLISVILCYRNCRRYPFLFRGIGFVIDGYVRSMSKALRPLDSVTKYSLMEEIKAHVEERSISSEGLSRREAKKKLEEEMGDPAKTGRRLIDVHIMRTKTSVRVLLFFLIAFGFIALAFSVYVGMSLVSEMRVTWGDFYVTPEGWLFIAVLMVLALSLVVFAVKQLTYSSKSKDYLIPSLALAVVVLFITSLGMSTLASGELNPTAHIWSYENRFLIDGVFENETGTYDVFWVDDLDSGVYPTEGSSHHSVLNEEGGVIEHRMLGKVESDYSIRSDKSIKIGDSYFFVGDSWIRVVVSDERSFKLVPIPDYDVVDVIEDNGNLGLFWVSSQNDNCAFHYGQVTQAAVFHEVWIHDIGRCGWYPTMVSQEDTVFLLWNDGSRSENHVESILRFGFFSSDGSVRNQGVLYRSNMTRSGLSDHLNRTDSGAGKAFWYGSRVWATWSHWSLSNGSYEYQFKLTSIDGYGSSLANFTLQVLQEDLSGYADGYDPDLPLIGPYVQLSNLAESGVVPYFFSVMRKSEITRLYETDLSVSDIFAFRVNKSGDLVYHIRANQTYVENPFIFPVSMIRDNKTYLLWIDLDEIYHRQYDSAPIHVMELSDFGNISKSRVLVTDVRMAGAMWSAMQVENAMDVLPDGSFGFIGLAGRPRSGLTEAVFGKSQKTPWTQQVVLATVDPTSERTSIHPISSEETIPDTMFELMIAVTLPTMAVVLFQWSYVQLRIRWSRSRGAL